LNITHERRRAMEHRGNIKIADLFLNLVISFKKLVLSTSKSDLELSMIREGFIVTSDLSLGQKRS
jgi:hypothetical protein